MAECSWPRARELAAGTGTAVAPTVVPLAAAAGAVLAEDVRARGDLPARDVAAMDGWAVAGPPPWRVVGEVLAGSRWPASGALAPGEAVGIATGAELPAGATAVVRRESGLVDAPAERPGGGPAERPVLRAAGPAPVAGRDVRPAGGECRRGEVVLPAGVEVGAVGAGLLAAAGLDQVAVRRVRADVLVLGDELLTSGTGRDGRVRDALGPLLSTWLPRCGVEIASRRYVPDDVRGLRTALSGCLADLVVTTGSTARGPVDHLHAVLREPAARLVVDGVAVRPGHPQVLAVLPDGRPLVGLPGNPLAAVSGLQTLLGPLVRTMRGLARAPSRHGVLTEDVPAGPEATRLVPVAGGRPVLFAGPAMLRGLAGADAMAVIPPGGVSAGEPVELLPLP